MNLNEPTAALRRVYFAVRDESGALVADAATGAPAGTIKTSSNGTALANAAGTFAAVGGGLHYYEATPAEAAIGGFLWVKFERDGYVRADASTTVGAPWQLGETTAAMLRRPFALFADGSPIAGQTFISANITKSTNGSAFAAAPGSIVNTPGDGVYYYQGTAADAATAGIVWIKIAKVGVDTGIVFQTVAPEPTGGGGGPLTAPVISSITPAEGDAGEVGSFSVDFRTARLTPITFHLSDVADGSTITVTVSYENRIETYTARDAAGTWRWPFDIEADNAISDITAGECDVSMLPRGGWPPCRVQFTIAAAIEAVGS